MTTLDRRLTALEDRAQREELLRFAEELASEFHVSVDEVLRDAQKEGQRIEAMQARGMTWSQIVAAYAEEIGVPVHEVEEALRDTER